MRGKSSLRRALVAASKSSPTCGGTRSSLRSPVRLVTLPDRKDKKMTYWLDLFTGVTWQEFLDAGGKVSGFRESRWTTVQKIKEGDIFLCYLTGVSRFVGALEVTGKPYQDQKQIWQDQVFPCRLPVKVLISMTPQCGVPVYDLRDKLSCFTNAISANAWTGAFRGSPARWSKTDGDAVMDAIRFAEANPRELPTDPKKLGRKPRTFFSKDRQAVTIPDYEETPPVITEVVPESPTEHSEIQALLLRLGADMGFDVWVARNDRSKRINGKTLGEFPRIKSSLPLQFDEATNRTIELIDVLWLKGNSIVAAFEVESTTSIYSGLLRMSDLTAMQPNLNIPLYLVAPDDRRDKVFSEINRPTFSKLNPPLSRICRFIAFSDIKRKIDEVGPYLRYMKPEFLEELSEECTVEEE